jgi:hypothetical protein
MVHDGQSKPTPGNVCTQLLLGACVLLVPPLLMVAGVMYEGSSPKDAGQQVEAEHTDKRPELAASFAVASAKQRPVISEPSSVAGGPAAPAASSTQKQISTRYKGPMTIGIGSEQSPTVGVESPQTAAVADLSSEAEQLLAERSPARSATPHFPDAVAAVEEAQPASPPGSNVSGNWVVQLSAQRTEEEAQSAFRTAQAKYSVLAGYQMLIRKKDQGKRGVFYATQVGPLPRDEANDLCNRIKSARGNCFVQTRPAAE